MRGLKKLKPLLKIGGQSFTNSLRYGDESRGKWIAQILGFSTLIFALYWVANASLEYAHRELGDALTLRFISFFTAVGMFMLLKDGLETSMRRLYEETDISLLLSSPLSPATVFAYKLISIVATNLFNLVVWLLPPWLAVAKVFEPSWHFYIFLLPTLLLLLIILITIISTIVMIIYRFFASRKMMLILKVSGIMATLLMGIGLAIFFTWGLPQTSEMVEYLTRLRVPVAKWYPHVWVGKFLSSFLPDASSEPLWWGMLILLAGVSLPLLSILIATRIYYRSWELSRRIERKRKRPKARTSAVFGRESRRKPQGVGFHRGFSESLGGKVGVSEGKGDKRKRATLRTFTRGRLTVLCQPCFIRTRAFIRKESWLFLRNRKQVLMLVMLSIIILLTLIGFIRSGSSEQEIASSLVVVTGQIILYSMMVSMGLTWGAFKSEGDAWWLLQSSPLPPSGLFHAKLMFSMLFTLLYTVFWIGVAILLLRPTTFTCLLTPLSGGIVAIGLAAINTAVGSLPWMAEVGVEQNHRNPTARAATIILSLIIDIFLLIGSIFLLVTACEDNRIPLLNIPPSTVRIVAVGIVLFIFAILIAIAYFIGKKYSAKLLMME